MLKPGFDPLTSKTTSSSLSLLETHVNCIQYCRTLWWCQTGSLPVQWRNTADDAKPVPYPHSTYREEHLIKPNRYILPVQWRRTADDAKPVPYPYSGEEQLIKPNRFLTRTMEKNSWWCQTVSLPVKWRRTADKAKPISYPCNGEEQLMMPNRFLTRTVDNSWWCQTGSLPVQWRRPAEDAKPVPNPVQWRRWCQTGSLPVQWRRWCQTGFLPRTVEMMMPNRFLTRTVEKRDVFSLTRSRTASLTASLGKMIWVGVLRSWSGPASSPPFVPVTTKPCKTIHHLRTEYETVNNKHSKFFT